MMKRPIVLLVVLLMVFGPFAQGVDVGLEVSIGPVDVNAIESPASIVQPDARELLSNIDGFFIENLGQKGEGGGAYYCDGGTYSVAFDSSACSYVCRPRGSQQGVVVRLEFEGANEVVPLGLSQRTQVCNFFIGSDQSKWVSGARTYNEIVFPDLYDDVDLRYYFQDDCLKYDLIVRPGGDPDIIRMRYSGVNGVTVDAGSGNLIIGTLVGTIRDSHPVSFQDGPEGPVEVPTSFIPVDERTIAFEVGKYDPTTVLTIDPSLIFSTYIGGTGSEWVTGSNLVLDSESNVLFGGATSSSEFPVTAGAFDTSLSARDGFIMKVKGDGSDVIFSTFIGGSAIDACCELAVGPSGDIYVGGRTESSDLPTTPGAFQRSFSNDTNDAFAARFNNNCSELRNCTYFGGNDRDCFYDCHLNEDGSILFGGTTRSTDLPTVSGCYDATHNGGRDDAFLVKMDANLSSLLAMTYLGGSDTEGSFIMAVDDDGRPVVAGYTKSNDYPTTSSAYQSALKGSSCSCYLTKFDTGLTRLEFSTYLGGNGEDIPNDVQVDGEGRVYLTGVTSSDDYPLKNEYDSEFSESEAFVSVLSASGDALEYSTYIGGSGTDWGRCVQPWVNDSVLVGIWTHSDDLPANNSAYKEGSADMYVCWLDIVNSTLLDADYIGGNDYDSPTYMIARDSKVTLLGLTNSDDFPTTVDAYDRTNAASQDLVLLRYNLVEVVGEPPSVPVNVTVEAKDSSVAITWKPPFDDGGQPIRGYTVYVGTSETELEMRARVGNGTLGFNHTYLVNGREYFYTVSAFNFIGESPLSPIVNATPLGLPSTPMDLTAEPGCGTIALSWKPPVLTGGLPILGYLLERGTTVLNIEHMASLGNILGYQDTDVENGTTYFYRIRAFNEIGNGSRSEIVPAVPVGPPSAPIYLQISTGDAQIELQWRAPLSDGGSSLFGYRIYRGLTEGSLERHRTLDPFITTYKDIQLMNGITYNYAVQTFNEIGDSPLSVIVNGTPLGLPGVPLGLEVEAGDGYVTLSWDPPEVTGGTEVQRFQIFRGVAEDSLTSLDFTFSGDITTYTDSGLMNGQTFYYAVCAVNEIGDGPWTEVVTATPLALPDAPEDLVAIAGNGMVTISWLPPMNDGGAEVTTYNIYRGRSENTLELLRSVAKYRFIYDDADVVVGTTYYYGVTAVTDADEGPKSVIASATPYGPPGVPTGLEVFPGNREVRLTWSPPEDDGASPIEGYVILRGTSVSSLRELAQRGDVTSYLDTSVSNNQTYYYSIAAFNEAGPGDHTDIVIVTQLPQVTAPGKVTTLVTDAKGAKVTLQWTAPQDDGGSPVTGYVILRGLTKDSLEQIAEVGPGVTTWSEDGLERGTTYYYSVAAKNVVGEGEAILAREVKVPPKSEESPGFEVIAVLAALLIVVPIVRRRVV